MADSDKNEELEDVLARVAESRDAAKAEVDDGFDWRKVVNFLIIGALAALLIVNVVNLLGGGKSMGIEGQQAPGFALETVEGNEMVALAQHEGDVVLLDFWATWCPPCKKQMPVIQSIHEDESLEGVKILSINTDERSPRRRDLVRDFLDSSGYTFQTLLDTGKTQSDYGIRSIPALIVVGPDGVIEHSETGVHSEDELRRMIQSAR
ncbi:MAG: TlpA family protein disulfide reductase [Myxococcota bacterium]